jgi:hypothetical protein
LVDVPLDAIDQQFFVFERNAVYQVGKGNGYFSGIAQLGLELLEEGGAGTSLLQA